MYLKTPQNDGALLDSIPSLINKTFPIPGRFRNALPSDIAELSGLLTNRRGDRSLSYLTRANHLSAYLHYFLPWNLYRLCLLLPNLEINLSPGEAVADLGCGPMTFACALWIARPDLRNIPLEFYCIDRSSPVLEAGMKFFNALTVENADNKSSPWKIIPVKEDVDIKKKYTSGRAKRASLVCAVNIYNEFFDRISHNNTAGLRQIAANAARFMLGRAEENASFLVIEPGVPQSGHFISLLRGEFIDLGYTPASPCTHASACPCAAGQKRWCHFAFETTDAPKELMRLSTAAKLPKERLVMSFLHIENASRAENSGIRVISDVFSLPGGRFGRYGCSADGLLLLTGDKYKIDDMTSFSLINVNQKHTGSAVDQKSGAKILELQ